MDDTQIDAWATQAMVALIDARQSYMLAELPEVAYGIAYGMAAEKAARMMERGIDE